MLQMAAAANPRFSLLPVIQPVADFKTPLLGNIRQNSNHMLAVNSKNLAQGVEGRGFLPSHKN